MRPYKVGGDTEEAMRLFEELATNVDSSVREIESVVKNAVQTIETSRKLEPKYEAINKVIEVADVVVGMEDGTPIHSALSVISLSGLFDKQDMAYLKSNQLVFTNALKDLRDFYNSGYSFSESRARGVISKLNNLPFALNEMNDVIVKMQGSSRKSTKSSSIKISKEDITARFKLGAFNDKYTKDILASIVAEYGDDFTVVSDAIREMMEPEFDEELDKINHPVLAEIIRVATLNIDWDDIARAVIAALKDG